MRRCGRTWLAQTGKPSTWRFSITSQARSFATTKAQVQLAGYTLKVRHGDLTEEDTDAIVNAANEMLMHGGGLAAAIKRKGGQAITVESAKWITENGALPVGGVAVTSGGDLPCKYVIHAVGPVWKGGNKNEVSLLATAIRRSLNKANNMDLRSISIPAVSSGIFGFPKEMCAKVIIDAAAEYCESHPLADPISTLSVIHFTNFDQPTVDVFLNAFKARWPKSS